LAGQPYLFCAKDTQYVIPLCGSNLANSSSAVSDAGVEGRLMRYQYTPAINAERLRGIQK
jgi:hypothetical protein